MAPLKCCVLDCESTSDTHRLFCMLINDHLRNLWMSFLVPVNPHLLGLTKGQLMTKRVCQKHFDETQFSPGSRIRYSYPCLFTEKEFFHGVPLSSEDKRVNNPQETMETTAAVVLFFDELFDCVNGSPGQGKGKLRCAVKETSNHKDFWQNALRTLQSMTFLDRNSKQAKRNGQPRHVRVPCLEGWITTLKSFLGLSKILFSKYKVKYFYPRFVNQDPIENFFGRIRAINYRNVNPDVNTFIYSFKSIVLSNILAPQSTSMNCEDDDGETLINVSNLFFTTSSEDEKEKILKMHTLHVTAYKKYKAHRLRQKATKD
ncbi:uncharacterized protein LOC133519780 [Cydia pomonella]|uniref:uncharacterized protein LOC133519780 n=1 Tax=Cydia pomonella TaxID=82600 RepID=UPI002ADDBF57|nr:uncharacterized protein LOC133519780 [Cydia pomonella]